MHECFKNLPYDILHEIAVAAVVSSEPIRIVPLVITKGRRRRRRRRAKDPLIDWEVADKSAYNLSMMYANKWFYELCSRSFLSENTWSFAAIYVGLDQNWEAFAKFSAHVGRPRITLIKKIILEPCDNYILVVNILKSQTRNFSHLRRITVQLHPDRSKAELDPAGVAHQEFLERSRINPGSLPMLFAWIRELEVVDFVGDEHRPGRLRRLTMAREPKVVIRDYKKVTVICDE